MNKDDVLSAFYIADSFQREQGPWEDSVFKEIFWSDRVGNIEDLDTLCEHLRTYYGFGGTCALAYMRAAEYFKDQRVARVYFEERLSDLKGIGGEPLDANNPYDMCVRCSYGRNICTREYKMGGNV